VQHDIAVTARADNENVRVWERFAQLDTVDYAPVGHDKPLVAHVSSRVLVSFEVALSEVPALDLPSSVAGYKVLAISGCTEGC